VRVAATPIVRCRADPRFIASFFSLRFSAFQKASKECDNSYFADPRKRCRPLSCCGASAERGSDSAARQLVERSCGKRLAGHRPLAMRILKNTASASETVDVAILAVIALSELLGITAPEES